MTSTTSNNGFTYDQYGNATYTVGQDKIVFPAGELKAFFASLAEYSSPSRIEFFTDGVYFQLNPPVGSSIYQEYINWDPTTGQTNLYLLLKGGRELSTSSLGQINPGDTLHVNGPNINLNDANGNILASTAINADGSLTSIFDNADGTKTVRTFDSDGVQTSGPDFDGTPIFYDPTTHAIVATEHLYSDGSGYVYDVYDGPSLYFAAGNKASVAFDGSTDTITLKQTAANGIVDVVTASPNGQKLNINGHMLDASFASGPYGLYNIGIDYIGVDSEGNVNMGHLHRGGGDLDATLYYNTDSSGKLLYNGATITFAANTLSAIEGIGAGGGFGLISSVKGYGVEISYYYEGVTLDLVNNATGTYFSSRLGDVNSTDTLKILSNTLFARYDNAGHMLNSTTLNTDGSQLDTNYNADGTIASVYAYNVQGTLLSIRNQSAETLYYYDSKGTQQATQQINTDGSSSVTTANKQTVNFAAGNVTSVVISAAGDTVLTTKTQSGKGITEVLDLSSSKIVSTVNGKTFTYTQASAGASIDASGNITLTGNGGSLVIPADGSNAVFKLGQESLSFSQSDLQSLSLTGNVYTFGVTSLLTGKNEAISWNSNSGIASLVLTSVSGGTAVTTSIGPIKNGDVLTRAGNNIQITNSGAVIASTTVYADGSQLNIYYNNTKTVKDTATSIDANGQTTSIRWDNADGSTYTSYASGTLVLANCQVNADGSGYLVTQKGAETVRFAGGATVSGVTVNASGDVAATVKASNGIVDTFNLTGRTQDPVMKMTVNRHTLADADLIKDIYQDTNGNLDIKANVAGFGQSDLLINQSGSESYSIGNDTLSFAVGSLASFEGNNGSALALSNPNNGEAFGLVSAASGFNEDISWNPTTGKALLNLTNQSTGKIFSSSLGYINPGDTLKVLSSSTIGLFDAKGHEINATTINSDGSQADTNYNPDGSVASVYNYDASGNQVNGSGSNGGVVNYSNTSGNVQAFGQTNADGSGYLYFEQGATLRYSAGALKQSINVTVSGTDSVDANLVAANGVKDQIIGSGGATQNIRYLQLTTYQPGSNNGDTHFVQVPIHDVYVDQNGSYTITAGTNGFGLSTTVINADVTGSYTIGNDKIAFASFGDEFDSSVASPYWNSPSNLAFDPNSVGFSTDAGIFDFNPTTGQVKLIASSYSQHFISIGQINPGDTLEVGAVTNDAGKIDLVDASGHVLEETTLNADFTTKVQTFNAAGAVSSTSNYDKFGNLQVSNQMAQLTSAMASFTSPTAAATSSPILITSAVAHPNLVAAH